MVGEIEYLVRKNKIEFRFKDFNIIIKMGFKSSKNTRNVNQSNGRYEVDDLIFYSKFVYENIKSIDEYLRLLYTIDSNVRNDEILGKVEELIKKIKNIDDWLINDLYKEKYVFSFLKKFKGINNCYKEYQSLLEKYGCMELEFGNNFERRIVEIKMSLSYIGVDFYED